MVFCYNSLNELTHAFRIISLESWFQLQTKLGLQFLNAEPSYQGGKTTLLKTESE